MKTLKTNLLIASLTLLAGSTGALAQSGDFNNDGFADFIVAAPREAIGSKADAGAVWVFYGGASGIQMTKTIAPDASTLGATLIGGERFGSAVCVGDFDNDGFADAAIGLPNLMFKGDYHKAAVAILFGSSSGLKTSSPVWKFMDEDDDMGFGEALAAGDFNGDGRDDLAVGAPLASVYKQVFDRTSMRFVWEEHPAAGRVYTYTSNGAAPLATASSIDYLALGMTVEQAEYSRFGESLAAGDYNGDGKFDLAVTAPDHDGTPTSTGVASLGAVHVLYSNASGLSPSGWQMLRPGTELKSDGTLDGCVLAAGKFNSGACWDLAMGCPESLTRGGIVRILYGGTAKFRTDKSETVFSQSTPGMANDSGITDHFADCFGGSLAVGRLNSDGYDDLAIGIPTQDFLGTTNAGAVQVLFGKSDGTGLSVTGNQFLHQADSLGISGARETNDMFGLTVTATRKAIDRSATCGNLIIGVPFEDVNVQDDGMVQVLRGGTSGVVATGHVNIHQDTASVPGACEAGDRFGDALGAR